MYPPPLMSALFLPLVLLLPPIPIPSVLQPLVLASIVLQLCHQPLTAPTLLLSAGIIETTPTKPRNVVHRVPGRETDGLAGGCVFPACHFYKLFSGYLQDQLSSHHFLVDSGASISVFPASALSSTSDVKLLTADGSFVLLRFQDYSSTFWCL